MPEMLQGLIGPVTATQLGIALAAVLIAGFIRGFVGFGASLIIVMVLGAVFGPLVAVPVAGLAGMVSTAQLLPTAIRDSERRIVLPFGIATFATAPLGTLLLVVMDPAFIKVAISVFVLLTVAMLYRDWRFPGKGGPGMLLAVGAAAGLVQGAAGVGGPPGVALALSVPGTPERQRANVIGVITSLALCGLLPLYYHGLFTRETVMLALLLIPAYSAATWSGARFFGGRGRTMFRGAALLTLAVIGVVTLVLALIRG